MYEKNANKAFIADAPGEPLSPSTVTYPKVSTEGYKTPSEVAQNPIDTTKISDPDLAAALLYTYTGLYEIDESNNPYSSDNGVLAGFYNDAIEKAQPYMRKYLLYLYQTKGEESAKEYYDTLVDWSNSIRSTEVKDASAEAAEKYPVITSAGSVGLNLINEFTAPLVALAGLTGTDLTGNEAIFYANNMTSEIRAAVANSITNDALKKGYQATMSVADNLANFALSVCLGSGISSAVTGASSFTSAVKSLVKDSSKLTLGLMSSGAFVSEVSSKLSEGVFNGESHDLRRDLRFSRVYIRKSQYRSIP